MNRGGDVFEHAVTLREDELPRLRAPAAFGFDLTQQETQSC